MLLTDAIEMFLDTVRLRRLSEHTGRAYSGDLALFRRWTGHRLVSDALTPEEIKQWRATMDETALAPASIKRRLAALKALCKWLEREAHIENSPFRELDMAVKLPKRLPRNLGRNDLRRLLEAVRAGPRAGPHTGSRFPSMSQTSFRAILMELLVEVLLATGIRIGEACSIRLGDLDLADGTIRIQGKGSRERQVFILDAALTRLTQTYLTARAARELASPPELPTAPLLLTPRGLPASPDYLRRKLREIAETAGITPRVTPHMLRHTAATEYLERGVDIRHVQRLLGHASIATTEIYTHVTNDALREALRGAGRRKR